MWDIILDTLIDSIKMLPFLFLAYLIIEYVEHRSSSTINRILTKSGKTGPIGGAVLGCFPQCGFSVMAANLYADRLIPIGTFLAVLISTSDEAIPVLLANPGSFSSLWKILVTKLLLAIVVGILVNLLFSGRVQKRIKTDQLHSAQSQSVMNTEEHSSENLADASAGTHSHHTMSHCCGQQGHHEHEACSTASAAAHAAHNVPCGCAHHHHKGGIFRGALQHTGSIFLFIVIVTLLMNIVMAWLGEERLSMILMSDSMFQPAIAGLIGLIPNCAASVVLTELYLAGSISFGSIIAGLTTSVGVGFVVLFKTNHKVKENVAIVGTVYGIGVLVGTILQVLGVH